MIDELLPVQAKQTFVKKETNLFTATVKKQTNKPKQSKKKNKQKQKKQYLCLVIFFIHLIENQKDIYVIAAISMSKLSSFCCCCELTPSR